MLKGPSQHAPFDMVLLDVRLPGKSGLEILKEIRSGVPSHTLPVVMISGHASIQDAVQSVQSGANDFLEKPLDRGRVIVTVKNVLKAASLEREVRQLRVEGPKRDRILGQSPQVRELVDTIQRVAATDTRVLILGESGTGKELVARAVHRLGRRAEKPFVQINCAAIPSDLVESELFGYEKGAFTGANEQRRGLFEAAHGGTLFLDEIGEMDLAAQSKLLRVLENRVLYRVGGRSAIPVDVRIVAATNRNLLRDVSDGRFREDLYYRLSVLPLQVPPLRDRIQDIPVLVEAFLSEFCARNGFPRKKVAPEVWPLLQGYQWPGNIRELRNIVERMVVLSAEEIGYSDVPGVLDPAQSDSAKRVQHAIGPTASLREVRDGAERAHVLQALKRGDWNISRTATSLGVERTHLHKRIRALGIEREDTAPAKNLS